jgi:hypothetical protein
VLRVINYLQIACVTITIISCDRKAQEKQEIGQSKKQIKILTESIHDPVMNSGILEYNEKNSKNSVITRSVFNSEGDLIDKSVFNSMGNLDQRINLKYDKHGNNLETDVYSSNGSLSGKIVNTFNPAGKLIECKEVNAKGKMIGKQTVGHNSDGNTSLVSYTVINGSFIKTQERVTDEHDRNIENYYFTNGKLTSKDINRYDARGNRIEALQEFPLRNEKTITQYKYDDKNNNIEAIVLDNNMMLTARVISRYDDKNNLIETLTYGILGSIIKRVKHTYEYDDDSNWTKEITFVNSKPVSVTIHRIEYY